MGRLTLIASTTENPYFYVYNAVLSRSTVFEFKPLAPEEVLPVVERGIRALAQTPGGGGALGDWGAGARGPKLCRGCAQGPQCGGGRSLLPTPRTLERLSSPWRKPRWWPSGRPTRYDREGDSHYDLLSAFQKSIRGSDPDAAVHYLARLLEAGDLISALPPADGDRQ